MEIVCKFKCEEITESMGGHWEGSGFVKHKIYGAKFSVVTEGSEENKQFFASTPAGELKVYSINPRFEPGKEYYIKIEEAAYFSFRA